MTQAGDLWLLRDHRLLCADARKPESFKRLLAGDKAQLVFAEPPYNAPTDGLPLGLLNEHEFAALEITEPEYIAFLRSVCANLVAVSTEGSIHFICTDWRHAKSLLIAGDGLYPDLQNICVWTKTKGDPGSLYPSQYELIFVWKAGSGAHINNIDRGRSDRCRTDLWYYVSRTSLGCNRQELVLRPTVKPVALVADAIRDCSERGDLVLDPFVGCGTTLIAAEKTGRRLNALEHDTLYVDTAVRRWQQFTGDAAVHETGSKFSELEHNPARR